MFIMPTVKENVLPQQRAILAQEIISFLLNGKVEFRISEKIIGLLWFGCFYDLHPRKAKEPQKKKRGKSLH